MAKLLKLGVSRLHMSLHSHHGLLVRYSLILPGDAAAVDLKSQPGSITPGAPVDAKPGVTLTLSDDDVVDLVSGKLDAQKVIYFLSHHH